jgi:nicotinamidase-related amidase
MKLLILDMQNDFFRHERLAQLWAALVANINALAVAARGAGAGVIWARQEFAPDLADASLEVRRNAIHVVIAGTEGAELLPELNALKSDEFIVKKRYSALFGTDLDERLKRLACRQLVVAGVNTHACVRTTVSAV